VIKNFFHNKLSILLGSTHHDSPLSTLKIKEPLNESNNNSTKSIITQRNQIDELNIDELNIDEIINIDKR
jgi:hypothetical protein